MEPGLRVGLGVGRVRVIGGGVGRDPRPLADHGGTLEGDRGREQAQDHAGDRRVHARAIGEVPEQRAHHRVSHDPPHMDRTQDHDQEHHRERSPQREHAQAAGVEHGDDHDRADVVHDREREQERLEAGRGVGGRHRERSQGERDVGGHWHAPAVPRGAPSGNGQIQQGGQHHAAGRRHHGKDRRAEPAQLAHGELTFDLQPHHQEEEGHQPLVDPEVHAAAQPPGPDRQAHERIQEAAVSRAPGRVRPDQGGRHRHKSRMLLAIEVCRNACKGCSMTRGRKRSVCAHASRSPDPSSRGALGPSISTTLARVGRHHGTITGESLGIVGASPGPG